jgi:hypothetical protein
VVEIGLNPKRSSGGEKEIPYLYFVVLSQFETSQIPYLFYYGYNHNYSQKGEVGYFKCGEEVTVPGNKLGHI